MLKSYVMLWVCCTVISKSGYFLFWSVARIFWKLFYQLEVKIVKVLLMHKNNTYLCYKANKLLQLMKCYIIEYLDGRRWMNLSCGYLGFKMSCSCSCERVKMKWGGGGGMVNGSQYWRLQKTVLSLYFCLNYTEVGDCKGITYSSFWAVLGIMSWCITSTAVPLQ